MKKFMSLMLAAAITAGGAALFNQNAVKANAEEADNTIKAVAHYEFNTEADLLKDSSVNGFNLLAKDTSIEADGMKGVGWGEEEGKTFAKVRRTFTSDDEQQKRGGYLYAPALYGSKDFSDFLNGSFTFSIEFRGADIPEGKGSYYLMETGRYNSAMGIEPWDKLTKVFVRSQAGAPSDYEDKSSDAAYSWANGTPIQLAGTDVNAGWNTITVSADANTNTIKVFYNGVLKDTMVLSDEGSKVLFSGGELYDYTFCLGAQCNVNGGAADCFGSYDISDVRVYDMALSDANVAKIVAGEEAVLEEGMVYATEIQGIQSKIDAVDRKITDKNKLSDIIKNLPKSVMVNTSDGSTKKTNVVWYKAASNQLKCYLQCKNFVNSNQLSVATDYGYTLDFEYNNEHLRIYDVQLDGEDFAVGSKVNSLSEANVTFKVEKLNPQVNITMIEYDGMEYVEEDLWDEDFEYFSLDIYDGAKIVITTEENKPASKPSGNSGKKGCGGSVNAELAIFGLLTAAAAGAFIAKRKEN